MKTPYIILSQETEEDALELAGRFTSLDAASSFIQQYWQDVDHIINKHSFCTDYAAYTLVGFWLEDIGSFVKEPGTNWGMLLLRPGQRRRLQRGVQNHLYCTAGEGKDA
jgi:hypothetical protein